MRLKKQFIIFSSMLIFESILIMVLAVGYIQKQILKSAFNDANFSQARNFAQVCQESLITSDDISVINYIQKIEKSLYGLKYIVFHDVNGVIKAHSDTTLVGMIQNDLKMLGSIDYRETKKGQETIVEYAVPVYFEKQKVGFARLGFDKSRISDSINQSFFKTVKGFILGTGFSILLGLVSSLYLYKKLMGPLETIQKGIKAIGEGNLQNKIQIDRGNEFSLLADAINEMTVRLSELDTMKNDFVSSVTHELRSPLSAIKGYVSFLLSDMVGTINNDQREYLTIIQNNSGRLANFINNVLDVAKIEASKIELNRESFDFVQIIRDLVQFYYPLVTEKKISLKYNASPDNITLYADKEKLNQVLTNLVNNAIKFTPSSGTITIHAQKTDSAGALPSLQVSVKDTGIGIPAKDVPKVFDKFYQVKGQKKTKGTGLGLAIVKGFVELHGGKIWVESEENVGTEFIFTMPVRNTENAEKGESNSVKS